MDTHLAGVPSDTYAFSKEGAFGARPAAGPREGGPDRLDPNVDLVQTRRRTGGGSRSFVKLKGRRGDSAPSNNTIMRLLSLSWQET